MTKYIHYKDSPHTRPAVISDNRDETSRGHTLYLEIEVEDFNQVLKSIARGDENFYRVVISDHELCDYSANSFKDIMLYQLENDVNICRMPYRIKIHRDGIVVVYSREMEG